LNTFRFMRKKIIAANWKMNLNYAEAMSLTDTLTDSFDGAGNCFVILAAPFVYLHDLVSRIQSHPDFSIAAQNCYCEEKGAYTGEISAAMLASIGVEHVIIGHSERRSIFKETDSLLAGKVSKALEHGLVPIFCCGEDLAQRNSGNHFATVEQQLNNGLFHINKTQLSECIIAYEPVWAIGTGINASAEQAQEMHSFIRKKISEKFGNDSAQQIPVLYGGSVTSKNAEEIFNCPDVDGGLVGGASLKSAEFLSIIQSMNSFLLNKN
jgi:triosephosphate isomerase